MGRQVRMKFSFVGYRWTGGPAWPAFNEVLETSDEEAAKLVAGEWAVYLEDEPEPVTPGWNALRHFSDGYDPTLDPDNQQQETPELAEYEEEEAEPGPKRPYTNQKKEDWIAYAVEMGEAQDVAERMSKVDLISKYGASL